MKHEYRKMTNEDLELIVEFELKSREFEPDVFPDFDEEKYRIKYNSLRIDDLPCNDVILCLEGDKLIGRIDLISEYSFMDFISIGYIDWVYVLKPYRGRGIAKSLFKEAEKLFKQKNINEYYLFVASNDEAQNFYKSLNINIKMVEKASKKL
ncbi:GNAT family N-acetyltransferase [Mycoplasmatota bacterium WC44]